MRILFSVITLTVFSLPLAAENARIAFMKGRVQVTMAGKTTKARIGMTLKEGATLTTSKKSMVLLALKRGRLKVRANTRLSLARLSGQTDLRVRQGSVFAKVNKGRRNFNVRTPTVVAGVRGTQFFVAYGDKIKQDTHPESMLCVNEGQVEVNSIANPEKKVLLNEGEGIVVTPGEGLPTPEKLPWIRKFNWNMDENAGEVDDQTSLKEAYKSGYDMLDQDYD